MNEHELIKKAKEGDSYAFELLIAPYMQKIYNIALGILSSSEDADDAAQEAFIKAYKHLHSFSESSGFYTWLYRIVYNCCLDILRKKQRRPLSFFITHHNDETEDELIVTDTKPQPDEILISSESQSEVRRAISMLKESYRTVIILRDLEGLSYEEIADITGLSLGTVKSRISRGRENLKNIIINNFPELFENPGVK